MVFAKAASFSELHVYCCAGHAIPYRPATTTTQKKRCPATQTSLGTARTACRYYLSRYSSAWPSTARCVIARPVTLRLHEKLLQHAAGNSSSRNAVLLAAGLPSSFFLLLFCERFQEFSFVHNLLRALHDGHLPDITLPLSLPGTS